MQDKILEIKSINKSYEKKVILKDISFSVNKGEIFGFLGLNGAGKTTLIKIIINLLKNDKGEILVFNMNHLLPSVRKDIAYLPEKFSPPNQLKGLEFIKFNLEFYNKKLNIKEVENLASDIDLDPRFLHFKVNKYSKGMVQKLGLIATFLTDAKLIILDEPMSGLDPKARINLKKQMVRYRDLDNTIFFSSHIMFDVDEICSNVAILNKGRISFCGEILNLKQKHSDKNLESCFLKEISSN